MFRLESLRDISGYTVKDVCEVLSCCRAQLYNLEHGKYDPDNVSYFFIKSLSQIYKVSIDDIYKIMCDDFSEVAHHASEVAHHANDSSENSDQYKLNFE